MSKDRVSKFLIRALKRTEGVTCIRIAYRRKHPVVKWRLGGMEYRYICPFSASDQRAWKNCLADVRRMMRSEEPGRYGAGCSRSIS